MRHFFSNKLSSYNKAREWEFRCKRETDQERGGMILMLKTDIDITKLENYFQSRKLAYEILKNVYIEEPTKELLKPFQEGLMEHFPFKTMDPQLSEGAELVNQYFESFCLEEDFDEVHWDYTRMFIGPNKLPVPIWASYYLDKDGLLFQEETLKVRRFYLSNRLISKQFRQEADDHLGLELDFMFHLSAYTLDLLREEKIAQIKSQIMTQKVFLEEHLLTWTPMFEERVLENADTDFYKGMAKVLNGFLRIDKQCLEELFNEIN